MEKVQDRLEFIAPLPPGDCSPNAHVHWRRKHKAAKPYREEAAILFRALGKGWNPGKVRLSFVFFCGPTIDKRYRPLDCENALSSVKPLIDGFVDGGMCPSDSYKWLSIGSIEIRRTKRDCEGKAHIQITVERVEP